MDRQIVYIGQVPEDTDILNTNLNSYIALSKLAAGLIGTTTQLNAFTCIPTAPASLNVKVTPGEIYQLENIDTSPYGSLPINSAQILKQGLLLVNTSNLSCPAPVTVGYSINYLIEIGFGEQDNGDVVLPFYNSANPSQAFSGPNNDSVPSHTNRNDYAIVQVKAGTAATTGTQTTPSADAGFVGAFVVTVAQGQTTIISGNISTYTGAPFISPTSSGITGGLIAGIQAGQYIYAADTSVSANTVTASLTPAITAYTTGMVVYIKIANTNTGTSTIALNGLSAKTIKYKNGNNLIGSEMIATGLYALEYDGTNFQLLNPSIFSNIQLSSYIYANDTGSANAYAVALTPAPSAYSAGLIVYMKSANTNTTSSTLNVNTLGTKNIKLTDGTNPYAGAILSGGEYYLIYDGTNFQLLNPTESQAIQANYYTYATDTGSANAYAIAPTPAITAYVAGQSFLVKISNTNIGWAISSLTINTAGSYTVIPTLAFSGGGGTGAVATSLMGGLVPTAIAAAGTGYNVGDRITLSGGTNTTPCILQIATLTGGAGTGVATVTVFQAGSYSVLPGNPVSQASTTGSGTGATFTMAWGIVGTTISNNGSGYISPPIVTVSSGSGAITSNLNISLTLNVSTLGTKNIVNAYGTTPTVGQIKSGMVARFTYNGTSFEIENPAPVPDFITVLTSGSNTYQTPISAIALEVEGVGGGGGASQGGAAPSDSTAGNNTTFGSAFLTANGGGGATAVNVTGGVGGSASGGDININGGGGDGGKSTTSGITQSGGAGGSSYFGGGGAGSFAAGSAGVAAGSGGSGGAAVGTSHFSGGGGGAAGYFRKSISSPNATYSYSVGTGGSGVGGGDAGGGAGAAGIIIIKAKFQ